MPTSQVGAVNVKVANLGRSMGCLFCVEFFIVGIFLSSDHLAQCFDKQTSIRKVIRIGCF